ncbi:type I glyceraldehyde-3-phosphate dehydrogenase [Tenacibaculum maritimum]|uniref:Glyceraldehyde-3-phosphate dehydrogenase n=1 Tax=Tenacibaculum maritimum NCIMB 2154 TaxID=1349785 RepID=A0A2H1E8J8_9FLAO|nr:type I glyceraldehyde-3-phosphate dehydrogenase [Tenacibaculum maritimum]MCD9562461.1 type I glyceraldehyde-3-phosphate dehydrogenase [Tenacibaculum maritimum]MCD9564463.1 type I glyceraldehyde-3-phosphate dehydrogenase [Tenacibaculum maritimum]MCD9578186.1 type I glyceraldehyde-3-phosphate dehydrogenase [Tenacibaculum maritimum]MCD9584413.1 type I glyceraldehyde-3-phosphate dehydrogenase [Tenacibaculum maritimum]MCD9595581.1 type I glyceraldehyde-3-phosphate dehydrogenase [Tenacibaculum ma
MIKIGINGFGRIGRLAFRSAIRRENIEIVGINDLLDVDYLAYLLKYDSVHGRFDGEVAVVNGNLVVNGKTIRVSADKNPENLKWDEIGAEYIIESTGFFTTKEKAALHLKGGAKKVIISAPSKDANMYVMGVNHHEITKEELIISNASCTTNCLAPLVKVIHDNFGLTEGLMTTVHAATSTQSTVDGPNKKWRRGRSVVNNIIPTSTGAAAAVTKVIPEMVGKLTGMAVRVPVADVSLVDLTFKTAKKTSLKEIMAVLKKASETDFRGIIGYTEDEVVSQDFVSETRTSVIDAEASLELNEHFFKVISWYDNEFGYATKIVDLLEYSASL